MFPGTKYNWILEKRVQNEYAQDIWTIQWNHAALQKLCNVENILDTGRPWGSYNNLKAT